MYKIMSEHDRESTMNILERSINRFEFLSPGMLGFVGRVDQEKGTFWLVNHTNVYFVRSGYGYNKFRRFVGQVRETNGSVYVEGDFRLNLFVKSILIFHALFLIGVNWFAISREPGFIETLKLIFFSCISYLFPCFIIYRRIKETNGVDYEIINFIESILKS